MQCVDMMEYYKIFFIQLSRISTTSLILEKYNNWTQYMLNISEVKIHVIKGQLEFEGRHTIGKDRDSDKDRHSNRDRDRYNDEVWLLIILQPDENYPT